MKRTGNGRESKERRPGKWALRLAGLAVGAVLLTAQVWADDAAPTPAARAVRLSSVDGQVRLAQGSQVLATLAMANTPLFEGTVVTTGDNGRAEVQFEDGSVARLSPSSSLTLTVLRGQGASGDAEISLQSGLGYFEVGGSGQIGQILIRFGDAQVTPGGLTVLRVNLDTPPGQLAVFSGNAHVERGSAEPLDLHGGESVALGGTGPDGDKVAESIEPDSWDAWNSDRDQALNSEAAARTGAANSVDDSGNPAWNDLDANGAWYNVPDQGAIWSPNEAADTGFDPYGFGNWMYTPAYGYIFVSGYSWGYLPYQCGSWNYYQSFGWGWAPGMRGCPGWWGSGIYRPNIGVGFGGYRPPAPPHRPRPVGRAGTNSGAFPMIAVNRRSPSGAASFPARDRSTAVTIAGHTVQPLRPVSRRPQYEGPGSGYVLRESYRGTQYTVSPSRTASPGWSGSRTGGSAISTGTRTYTSSATRTYIGSQHASTAAQHTSVPTQHAPAPSHSFSSGGAAHVASGGGGHGGGGGHR